MTEHYEDDEEIKTKRVLSNRQVLAFIGGFWLRRPALFWAAVGLMLIAIIFDLMLPWAAGRLVDVVAATPREPPAAWSAWAIFVGVYLAFSLVRNLAFRFWNPMAAHNMKEMTDEGFQRVQAFSADWHADHFAGSTVRKLSRAMWGYDMVSDAVVLWLGPALVVLLGLSATMVVRWPMVGLFSIAVVVIYIASNLLLTVKYVRPANLKSVALDTRIGGALADSISANPTVKAFGAEPREEARIGDITSTWRKATLITWTRFIDVWLIQNMILVVLQAGLSGLLIRLWARGEASAGDVAFAVTSFLLMSGYLRNIGENIRMMQKGLDDVEDVAAFAVADLQVPDAAAAPPFRGELGEIAFDRVTFRYKSAEEPLYRDFTLIIAPGERVALVGPTGSGKSTFVKLLQRLYDVNGGRILIDGQDISKVTQGSLRRAIAVVPQDPALFHRTIAENIAYARPEATLEEIALAAKRARADDFIRRLPKGYDTLVGERGVKLSGGERQRVAIARAFLADAPILVLDEATSSLDVETERQVQAATEELMAGRTTIVIAHRLSTIRGADRILVFDQGRIVEEGRHAELVQKGGAYARLHAVTEGVA
ncbi:MAG: multidrug ABC transporter ATP-binding protein [Phenylobacterium sp. RIFCSPHIGHO2_01_FULL_69_31]|uniref:ABC transporter ATP-binding protein n=1 Tax=Phenylobacterium sp. RIFCSPHIGHO2_01_FULL_69_31 TaxID=1801944 RepID=UPI0008D0BAA6|nr:ABC transporter ATP-binding protein [Phenylobacterium sp. RIFCSPHIGHO2_01_FULL_69_31]OHB29279.1 MAG: multidrug ABC transporter ATP-binding protein [Phenylobacterium sp. RIFCSPHIGHO2_01_FULL_69_31]